MDPQQQIAWAALRQAEIAHRAAAPGADAWAAWREVERTLAVWRKAMGR